MEAFLFWATYVVYKRKTLGKIYGIKGALVRNLLGEFGEQIQNMINYHWALGVGT